MKTSISRLNRNATISLLDWPPVSPRLAQAISRPKFRTQAKVPHLRILPELGKNDLFKYSTAAKSRTELWETIVYAAMALAAIAALVLAFRI